MTAKILYNDFVYSWVAVAVMASVGAQGKSLVAEAVSLALQLQGLRVRVFSADVQHRLKRKLGACVENLDIDLLAATEDDPLAMLRAYSAFSAAIGPGPEPRPSVVLDTAATWDKPTLRYLHALGFDRQVVAAEGLPILVLVTTSNLDAVKSMIEMTRKVREALPLAKLVWVLNERHGPVFAHLDYEWLGFSAEYVQELRASVTEVTIRRMDERLWVPVDRAGFSMRSFVETDAAALAHFWPHQGKLLDPGSAAVVKGKIADWIGSVMEAAQEAIGFREP